MKKHPPVSPTVDASTLFLANSHKKERRLFAWTFGWAGVALLALGRIYAIDWAARNDLSKPPDPLSSNYPYDRIYNSYAFGIEKALALALLALCGLIAMICLIRWIEMKRRNQRAFLTGFPANPPARIS